MNSENSVSDLVLIYDGQCDFCKECVKWVERKCSIKAFPFQSADLQRFGVTYERCSKEVIVIRNEKVFGGASAVAQLLQASGYKTLAFLLRLSGALGRAGYKWIASHRDSRAIWAATMVLHRINRTI